MPTTGASHTWPFLIRTPENVEKGVRTLLQRLLGQSWDIRKEPITDSTVKNLARPDIVINGGYAVGDVKYKLFDSKWKRADLYQSVAYAAGLRTHRACVIGFAHVGAPIPPIARIGDIVITPLAWRFGPGLTPDSAAEENLAGDFDAWLTRAL